MPPVILHPLLHHTRLLDPSGGTWWNVELEMFFFFRSHSENDEASIYNGVIVAYNTWTIYHSSNEDNDDLSVAVKYAPRGKLRFDARNRFQFFASE